MPALIRPDQTPVRPPSLVVNPASYEALNGTIIRALAAGTGTASGTWPTANLSIGYPFSVSRPVTIVQMYAVLGAAASGNVDVGIYDDAGNLLISKGSTAQAGTSGTVQKFDTTDLLVIPGVTYYDFMALDNTTGTAMRWALATAGLLGTTGVVQVASNFPLATGVTFGLPANTYLPVFGHSRIPVF